MRLVPSLTFLLVAIQSHAHEWEYPHHDEALTHSDARTLGFEIETETIRWHDLHGRVGEKGSDLDAVAVRISYPATISGQSLKAADIEGCGTFYANIEFEEEGSGYSSYITDHVLATECASTAKYWAIYGLHRSETFYWLNYSE